MIADLDLISEQFFEIRRRKLENLDFDNVTFVLNCVDVLAGDDAYIALRKRRPQHRTLTRLEEQTREFIRPEPEGDQAGRGRGRGRARRGPEVARRQGRQGPRGQGARRARAARSSSLTLEKVENRRLDVEKAAIEDEKRRKVQDSKADDGAVDPRDRDARSASAAILAAPLPALLLGRPSSSASGPAARTGGPTRTGWPEPL